jgi:hypothetical protein
LANGIEQEGADRFALKNGVDEIIHRKESLFLGVYIDPMIDFRPGTIRPPCIGIPAKASLSLAIFEDYHLPFESCRMLKNSIDQPPQEIRICRSAAFPLAIDLDENDVIAVNDPLMSSPGMGLGRAVKLHPICGKKFQQGIKAEVTELTVVRGTIYYLKNPRLVTTRKSVPETNQSGRIENRPCCSHSSQEIPSAESFHWCHACLLAPATPF